MRNLSKLGRENSVFFVAKNTLYATVNLLLNSHRQTRSNFARKIEELERFGFWRVTIKLTPQFDLTEFRKNGKPSIFSRC